MERPERSSKRLKQADNDESGDMYGSSTVLNASSMVELILNSLASEAPQHPSSWPKQTALDICLDAVDMLKSQMKAEGHISFLPSWIKQSEFVRQYEEDYPGEVLKLDNNERMFELPDELDETLVVKVMDNIRYFGIDNNYSTAIIKHLFEFYVADSNRHHIEEHANNFSELKVLWENVDFALNTDLSDEKFMSLAASRNLLVVMQYAHENGCPWDSTTCSRAAVKGHLECLKYAHKNGCPWDAETCSKATVGGLNCLKYAHENGCPWDEKTCSRAAHGGDLDCLKYAHENGCPWNVWTCAYAASGGSLDYDINFPDEEPNGAIEARFFDCLKYAHENGCPWNERTCCHAAFKGCLDFLKYVHENGCLWDSWTSFYAAHGGHLDCLKYAHENGCP